ncbi:MAG: apolipoprotein N-acyltransferase, partial [Asticcacaulis sp.]|nr:apolipoprotein N-acyltransferase [Asticcacaulis sp.]
MTDRLQAVRDWVNWLDLPSRPRLLSALAGVLLGLAQPPFGILPGLLGYALLLWALERDLGSNPNRTAFFMGWLTGFGYFFIGCFWVAEAFWVDADTYGWMAIPAAMALPAGMALFWGAFAVLYRRFAPRNAWRVLWFAALFSAIEMTRGMIFSGFPWNPAGATWRAGSAMSQVAAYVGVDGLGFLTVLLFATPAVTRSRAGLQGSVPLIWAALVLAGLFGLGEYRLATTTVGTTG